MVATALAEFRRDDKTVLLEKLTGQYRVFIVKRFSTLDEAQEELFANTPASHHGILQKQIEENNKPRQK